MYDYSKLRGRIVEKFGSQEEFSKYLGVSSRTLSLKMNNKVEFNNKDIDTIIKLLDIDINDIGIYFFYKKSSSIELESGR